MGRAERTDRNESLPEGIEIRQWPSGKSTIRINFMYQGVSCRETFKGYEATAKHIKIASRLRGEILNRIRDNNFRYQDYFPHSKKIAQFERHAHVVTIGILLEDYRKQMEHSTEKSTYAGYRKSINYLMVDFKDIKIQDLKASMIRNWIQQHPVSLKTLRNYLIPFRAVVERALADDLIEKNPFDKIFPKRLVNIEKAYTNYEVDPFDEEEVSAIVNAASGQLKNLYQFAFFSGLRIEELVALRWDDIDWHHQEMHIQRSMVLDIEKEPKNRCKTHSSKRKVTLLPPAYQALMNQREHTYLLGEFIFHNPNTNQPWYSYKAYYRCWSHTVKAARIADLAGKKQPIRFRSPKNTRHTYASTLLSRGENLLWVSTQMGHADTRITQKSYARWLPDKTTLSGYRPVHDWQAHFTPKTANSSI